MALPSTVTPSPARGSGGSVRQGRGGIPAFARMALLALLAVGAQHVCAVTFTVTSTADLIDDNPADGLCHTTAGTCTLRAAVMQANRATGIGTTIVIPAGVYNLTLPGVGGDGDDGGDLNLTTPASGDPYIHLTGAGATLTVIDANQIDRVFDIGARAVTINDMTLRNGYDDTDAGGGGILNGGRLTLERIVLTGNSARFGGAIHNAGTLQATSSSFVHNVATGAGGFVWTGGGGGISNMGDMTVSESAFAFNAARFGGGFASTGRVVLINSTIASNTAEFGGGIYNTSPDTTAAHAVNIYNSTVVGNLADSDHTGSGYGGGIYVYEPSSDNFNLYNSIVAGNHVTDATHPHDCYGNVLNHARNLFGVTTDCNLIHVSGNYALLNSLAFLGGLQDNGGPTLTIALLPGSNAIDGTISGVGCIGPLTAIPADQRGYARADGACDIGAFEFGASAPDRIFTDGFESM